jgi:cytidyltransferase-like protein
MKVYTTGVFDILHRGHLNILTQAAALGDLTVGIMTDRAVEEAKRTRPILTLAERDEQIRSLPFVAAVVHYSDTDQRAQYEILKPDIVVQGDDWLHSADRTAAFSYFRERGIRLVLLPRTEGISTTEIRRRVERSARRDESFLLEQVRLFLLDELRLFEDYDEAKVDRLCEKIAIDDVFLNPISIVLEKIVIDGANRLEALRRLGCRQIPCVVYDYADVDLIGNVHFINEGKTTRLSEFARTVGTKVEFPHRTPADILAAVDAGRLIPNGETFHRVPQSVIRLPVPLAKLRDPSGFDLTALIRERIERGQIRFCQRATYVCDEW